MEIATHIERVEEILGGWKDAIGDQFLPYRNHVYRLLNSYFALHPCRGDDAEKLTIAACLHDLGIWSDHTVDYLEPSLRLAQAYLEGEGKGIGDPRLD